MIYSIYSRFDFLFCVLDDLTRSKILYMLIGF
nr:MAG TPA: hypothetical protein [Caudoviricetes sp.]